MKNKILTAFLLLVAGNVFSVGNTPTEVNTDFTEFQGLFNLMADDESDYILLDVRTPQEYSDSHIPTAENSPYDIIASNLPGTDKNALIIVYCRSGRRSGIARKTLLDLGYNNVHDFGAYSKWKDSFIKGNEPGSL